MKVKHLNKRAEQILNCLLKDLTKKHSVKKFETTKHVDYRLVVERLVDTKYGVLYSVGYYNNLYGGGVSKSPEIVFLRDKRGKYTPYLYINNSVGVEKELLEWENGEITYCYEELQRDVVLFSNKWLLELKSNC